MTTMRPPTWRRAVPAPEGRCRARTPDVWHPPKRADLKVRTAGRSAPAKSVYLCACPPATGDILPRPGLSALSRRGSSGPVGTGRPARTRC